jgi:hypothetical protein
VCARNRHGAPWAAVVVRTAVAVPLVIPLAPADRDPVVTPFSWFSGVRGALGIAGAGRLVPANPTTPIGGDRTTATWPALTVPASPAPQKDPP